uniref:Uncharacterized protein n=1 Tax=Seriola dumerili TaxID=41447 RepID=A0A3B4T485_SERDU
MDQILSAGGLWSNLCQFKVPDVKRLELQDNNGHTALHNAASWGHTDIVRALLKASASIYTLDLHNKTPIHLAAENEHLDSVKVLVKEEAKQSESHTRDMFLHMAATEDNWRLA